MTKEEYEKKQRQRLCEKKWIDDVLSKGGDCILCGYNENPLILEEHHLAGRNNSDITIPVCPNCHKKLSLKQESWDKDWTKPNNPPKQKLGFELKGISDILAIASDELRKQSDGLLNGD